MGEFYEVASQALYRKWRSRTFEEVIGQEHVTQTLINALHLDRVAHAYLFSGPRGTGKTSTARLLAKAINCLAEDSAGRPCNQCHICVAVNEGRLLDLIEIDAASNTGVDDIRDLRDKINFRPNEARVKFYIIDEVHMLSNSAFNALLKTLEEPPAHVIFVLATTEPEKIPATITSRCQRFDFKRIKLEDITGHLAHIVEQEELTAEPDALEYIARQGGGSMRDAISLLDQLTAYGSGSITLELVQTVLGAVASQAVVELVDAVIDRDVASGLDIINQLVDDGADPRQLAREVVEYLRAVMLVKLGNGLGLVNLPEETLAAIKGQAARADAGVIVQATDRFNGALIDIKSGLLSVPQLPLELAFVETATAGVTSPAAAPTAAAPAAQPTAPPSSVAPQPRSPAKQPVEDKKRVEVDTEKITVDTVRSCFKRVLDEIGKKNKVMAETLRNPTQTQLYKVSGNEIYFVTGDMMKPRFEKPQPKAALNEAFSQALDQPVSVHFLSKSTVSDSTAGNEESAEQNTAALLQVAEEELGGQIVE